MIVVYRLNLPFTYCRVIRSAYIFRMIILEVGYAQRVFFFAQVLLCESVEVSVSSLLCLLCDNSSHRVHLVLI